VQRSGDEVAPGVGGSRLDWVAWLLGAAVLAAVVAASMHLAEEESFIRLLAATNPAWLVVALLLQATTYVLQGAVWRLTIYSGGHALTLARAARLSLAKLFLDQAVPSLGISGNVLVTQALQRLAVPRDIVLAAVVVDLASYYAAYVACLSVALLVLTTEGHRNTLIFVLGAVFLTIGSLSAWALPRLPKLLVARAGTIGRRTRFIAPFLRFVEGARQDLAANRGLLGRAAAMHVALIACDALTLWVLLLATGVHARPGDVFAAYMVAAVFRTLGILPGGLGTFEAAAVVMLHLIGVPLGQALSATLLFRGVSFWLPMIPGYACARMTRRGGPSAQSPAGL
jgi:Mg2+-importing ATPase